MRHTRHIEIVHAGSDDELERAFATLAQSKAGALLIAPDGLFIFRAAQVAALTVRHAIPASHERRAFPVAGGLMSNGASQTDGMRLAGALGGRVLKGEKPADLPLLRATSSTSKPQRRWVSKCRQRCWPLPTR